MLPGTHVAMIRLSQFSADATEEEELPDVETVGGLIVTWLGRPPKKGDEVTHTKNIHFQVLDVDGLAVTRARIEFPVPPENEEEQ